MVATLAIRVIGRYIGRLLLAGLFHGRFFIFHPVTKQLAVEGITRAAVRESNKFAIQLANGARQRQTLLPSAKQSSRIWARQADAITEVNAKARRSRIRTRLIVAATLTQFGVSWAWPSLDGDKFPEYEDEIEQGDAGVSAFGGRGSWAALRSEGFAEQKISLPSLPCRWKHCCECVHLGPVWCSKGHADC